MFPLATTLRENNFVKNGEKNNGWKRKRIDSESLTDCFCVQLIIKHNSCTMQIRNVSNRDMSKEIATKCQFWELVRLCLATLYDLCCGPALGLLTNVGRISMLVSLFQSNREKDKNTVIPWAEGNNEQDNEREEWGGGLLRWEGSRDVRSYESRV